MKKVFLCCLGLLGCSGIASADVDGEALLEVQSKTNIKAIFRGLSEAASKKKGLTAPLYNLYFNSTIVYAINGEVVARNYDQLTQRWQNTLKQVDEVSIKLPVKIINLFGNNVVVDYRIEKKLGKKRISDRVTALIRFEKGRVKTWRAVVSELPISTYKK